MFMQFLKKEVSEKVDILQADKLESLPEIYTTILMGHGVKHSQIPKIASLQCL